MLAINKVAIFCGSSMGKDERFQSLAKSIAETLLERKLDLIYGGGGVGLMGIIANTMMAGGGKAIGVIPSFLATKEIANNEITELIKVETMHERKALMGELCDAFLIIPGGIGTFEEFFEVFTWGQLGLHRKPIAVLNAFGYYDHLIAMMDHMVHEGFLRAEHRDMLIIGNDVSDILDRMKSYVAPELPVWFSKQQI